MFYLTQYIQSIIPHVISKNLGIGYLTFFFFFGYKAFEIQCVFYT